MSAPKVLLFSKEIEVTAGLFSVLADYFDVDVSDNTNSAGEACSRTKYDLLVMHCSEAVGEAVQEYQTLVAVCPGIPSLFLTEDARLVDFALKSFHPPAAAALAYPLTSPALT